MKKYDRAKVDLPNRYHTTNLAAMVKVAKHCGENPHAKLNKNLMAIYYIQTPRMWSLRPRT